MHAIVCGCACVVCVCMCCVCVHVVCVCACCVCVCLHTCTQHTLEGSPCISSNFHLQQQSNSSASNQTNSSNHSEDSGYAITSDVFRLFIGKSSSQLLLVVHQGRRHVM